MLTHPNLKSGINKIHHLVYNNQMVKYFELKEDNKVEWYVILQGNQEITLPFEYFVEHPKDHILNDLNF